MGIENASFEIAGASPGQAQNWTTKASVAGWVVAGFGGPATLPLLGFEGFEGWAEIGTLDDATAKLFETGDKPAEDFEDSWQNTLYYFEFSEAALAVKYFDTGIADHEDFEDGWNNVPYHTTWGTVPDQDKTFDPGAKASETFEDGWNNVPYYWSGAPQVVFPFDSSYGPTQTHEDFEDHWTLTMTTV